MSVPTPFNIERDMAQRLHMAGVISEFQLLTVLKSIADSEAEEKAEIEAARGAERDHPWWQRLLGWP